MSPVWTQPSSSSVVTVGDRLPGVMLVAAASWSRRMLYWHRTCFCAVMTPRIREAMSSTSGRFDGVAELWFDDLDVIDGRSLDDRGREAAKALLADEAMFIDLPNSPIWVFDEEVVVDQGLTSSRTPDDLPAFNAKTIEEISEGQHTGQTR